MPSIAAIRTLDDYLAFIDDLLSWVPLQHGDRMLVYAAEANLGFKGIRWSMKQLLERRQYANEFARGVFTHCFLNNFDFCHSHTPVVGVQERNCAGSPGNAITIELRCCPNRTLTRCKMSLGQCMATEH